MANLLGNPYNWADYEGNSPPVVGTQWNGTSYVIDATTSAAGISPLLTDMLYTPGDTIIVKIAFSGFTNRLSQVRFFHFGPMQTVDFYIPYNNQGGAIGYEIYTSGGGVGDIRIQLYDNNFNEVFSLQDAETITLTPLAVIDGDITNNFDSSMHLFDT